MFIVGCGGDSRSRRVRVNRVAPGAPARPRSPPKIRLARSPDWPARKRVVQTEADGDAHEASTV